MEVFKGMGKWGHEQVLFTREESVGYLGIIAIHDTTLGPALGGTRLWNYNSEEEAVIDVLRLSMGMTYKAAVAGLNLGGGKSVIIGDPDIPRREMIFRAHGRAVQTLKGRYITAEDVGTSVEDMDYVHMETEHVVGIAGRSGDPSPVTAYGTYRGMKACALEKYGNDSLKGKTVAVQGVGHVGYYLCENLAAEGAKLVVTDISADKVARCVEDFNAEGVKPEAIYEVDVDVFAPCALGAIVNEKTIPKLTCDIIAGAANNQLAKKNDDKALLERGILYAPDYVINAGGLINVYSELADWTTDRSKRKAGEIYQTLIEVFELARVEKLTTADAADRIAERRIEKVGQLHRARTM
jgi:leucine dehydrogenase